MRLSDIMSAAGLSGYAEVALVLFFVLFCGIVVWIFAPGRRERLERDRHLPFDPPDGPTDREGARR
jgi:cbb3-type cytochrome oxidase subunit 3